MKEVVIFILGVFTGMFAWISAIALTSANNYEDDDDK